jgi:hypothetical protein
MRTRRMSAFKGKADVSLCSQACRAATNTAITTAPSVAKDSSLEAGARPQPVESVTGVLQGIG